MENMNGWNTAFTGNLNSIFRTVLTPIIKLEYPPASYFALESKYVH